MEVLQGAGGRRGRGGSGGRGGRGCRSGRGCRDGREERRCGGYDRDTIDGSTFMAPSIMSLTFPPLYSFFPYYYVLLPYRKFLQY